MDWEKEAKYWKAKYEREYNSWLSLRTLWTNACHKLNDPDIRLILAKKSDSEKLIKQDICPCNQQLNDAH